MGSRETLVWMQKSKNILLYFAVLCVVFLASLPTITAIWNRPAAAEWTGLLSRNTSDLNIYISLIEQTRAGAYLCKNLFTPEPHDPFILRPSYFLLGLTGRLASSLSPVFLIEVGRLVAGFTLLLVFSSIARKVFKQASQAAIAVIFLSLGSGIGWMHLVNDPPDLRIVETSTFLNFLSAPHLCMALALVFLLFFLSDNDLAGDFLSGNNWLKRILMFICGLWIGLEFPFVLFNVGVALLSVLLLDGLKERKFPLRTVGHFLPACIGMGFAGIFFVYINETSPMMEIYSRQFLVLSPEPLRLLSAAGLLIPLAALGVRPMWNTSYRFTAMILTYAVAGTILAYSPVLYQERFLLGVPACLSLFAACGWAHLQNSLKGPSFKVGMTIVILALLVPSSLMGLRQDIMVLQKRHAPQYLPKSFLQGVREVRNFVPDQVIFASEISGNFIAGRACRPVVLGQFILTTEMQRKRSMVETFCGKTADDPSARRILEASGARWLFWGPPEILLARNGGFHPEDASYLERVYSNKVVSIYRIKK